MNKKEYEACKNKGDMSWNDLAESLGMKREMGEVLRCRYKRARKARNEKPTEKQDEFTSSESNGKSTFRTDGENIFVSYVDDHVPSIEEVMEKYSVNQDEWKVASFEVTDWQMGRKDIHKDLSWVDGVVDGYVKDSGMINRVWLHRINVKFARKTEEIRTNGVLEELIADAKEYAPVYKKINYPEYDYSDGLLYEMAILDAHLGRLSWHEESGEDYDLKLAEKSIYSVVEKMLSHAKNYPVSRILLPWGNDLMNVDNMFNTTTKGTPQQEDTRWQKTFRKVRQLSVNIIESCSQIAPVDVLIIAGNHDRQRMFYLGDSLESWFNNNPNVSIDNLATLRKYYLYGKTLLGFTHGSDEGLKRLPMLMPLEVPELWAKSNYREWHTGDKHRKYDTSEDGVVIRILRALTPPDAWTTSKGFAGSLRSAESFLWSHEDGLVAQFVVKPN